jgi:(p)ppGpp synthase/HD superfamily hydrolase
MKKDKKLVALELAVIAHGDQKDLAGRPYIHHVIRVAERMETDEEIITAYLHDVVEDTPVPLVTIGVVFGPDIALAVDALTRKSPFDYQEHIETVQKNPLARKVKIADILDHLAPERVAAIGKNKQDRYFQALLYLLSNGGHNVAGNQGEVDSTRDAAHVDGKD